jgi:hydrogenase maturation protein HypF
MDPAAPPRRLRLDLAGAVQGVGFRPFVHRLAVAEGLGGFVRNTGAGVSLEVEGPAPAVARFLTRLDAEITPPADIRGRHAQWLPASGDGRFAIAPSTQDAAGRAVVLPDLATCPDCLAETLDPADRRHRYPFTTCVRCGPRYSIIEAVPYDRVRTTMRRFALCAACRAEYDDPQSRRFHAETNACPACGPALALHDAAGRPLAVREQALAGAAAALRRGLILALKGLGGFQLLVDARDEAAVARLRARKRRPAKPFAVLAATLADAHALADIDAAEAALLCAPAAPIVLLRARAGAGRVAPAVAPDNPLLGVMLPATPLHHLLARDLGFPLVATSGNRHGEPIAAGGAEAMARLHGIADLFLTHDRPIRHPVDDSVVRVIAGEATVLRCARGHAPFTLAWPAAVSGTLALGGHQKSAVAVAGQGRIVLGPHLGDLDDPLTRAGFALAAAELPALHGLAPTIVARDAHPGYHGTELAARLGLPVRPVPHHLAHVLAAMAEHGLDGPVLGVAWDGTGDGGDGTVWGGEFLAIGGAHWRRVAHLWPFRLPGGEAAIRAPRRAALGVLHALHGEAAFGLTALPPVAALAPMERPVLARMLARGLNAPWTSSAGRLFDAVASLLGLCQIARFEGEAAMAVEFAADRADRPAPLPDAALVDAGGTIVVDWRPVLHAMLAARDADVPALAAGFHRALSRAILAVAERCDAARVVLTGGCFQNRHLTEDTVARLRAAGRVPFRHHRVPPNDGGLAVGQAAFAARPLAEEKHACASPSPAGS